jgi:hypothetical protein
MAIIEDKYEATIHWQQPFRIYQTLTQLNFDDIYYSLQIKSTVT